MAHRTRPISELSSLVASALDRSLLVADASELPFLKAPCHLLTEWLAGSCAVYRVAQKDNPSLALEPGAQP